MKGCFILSSSAISSQDTFQNETINHPIPLDAIDSCAALHPDYKKNLSPLSIRRMSTGVKMGVTTAKDVIKKSRVSNIDGIITGTGLGCIIDTESFLNLIINNNESFLTPTAFIQSTHNTVAAQIALNIKCKSYNTTYVQASNSFPSAILDAQLLLQDNRHLNIIVGGVDELGKEFVDLFRIIENEEDGIEIPFSEGAAFFMLTNQNDGNRFTEVLDVECRSRISYGRLNETINNFLSRNSYVKDDIDLLILGNNGDKYDEYYTTFSSAFKEKIPIIPYKNLCGEYYSAPAFGFWLADSILKNQMVPKNFNLELNDSKPLKTVLMYNQYKGRDHSLILLKG